MCDDNTLADMKTQSHSGRPGAASLGGAVETLEDLRQRICTYPDTAVGDCYLDLILKPLDDQFYRPVLRAVFQGVPQEIEQHLLDPFVVPQTGDRLRWQCEVNA